MHPTIPVIVQTAGDPTGIVALIVIFGPLFYLIKRRYDLKELKAQQEQSQLPAAPAHLAQVLDENRLLRERVEQLETIVCSDEFELNAKIKRLTDHTQRANPDVKQTG